MAKVTDEYVRRAFLARFARMGRESQEAVIEAMETIRDGTNLTDEGLDRPVVARAFDTPSLLEGQTMAFSVSERTPGAATILGESTNEAREM